MHQPLPSQPVHRKPHTRHSFSGSFHRFLGQSASVCFSGDLLAGCLLAVGLLIGNTACGQPAPENGQTSKPDQTEIAAAPLKGHRFQQIHMAMPVHLIVYAPTTKQAQDAGKAAYARVKALDQILSDWNPDSELNALCAQAGQGPVAVSKELFTVLSKAKAMAEATDGAFDPTASPVVRLWRTARKSGVAPTNEAMQAAITQTGHGHLHLNANDQTAWLDQAGMQLDVGGIAKGYIGDEVANTLKAHGIDTFLYMAGGDIVAGNAPPPPAEGDADADAEDPNVSPTGQRGWRIDPREHADASGAGELPPILWLANEASSISGDTVQFVVIDGVRYSHVVDVRTGQGITSRRMCVVRGAHGVDTDGLATCGTLLDHDAFDELLNQYNAKGWVFVGKDTAASAHEATHGPTGLPGNFPEKPNGAR